MTFIPHAIPSLTGNEGRYLADCVASTFVSSVGPYVTRFESMVAQAAGSAAAVATSSGTAGLHLALVTAGVRPGDLVILPSFTFIASANAISHCGATPWLMGIDPLTWCLDVEALKWSLARETEPVPGGRRHVATGRRVAAILPVHVLGALADMARIVALGREYSMPVIADGAAALGAVAIDGEGGARPVGALGADLTVFSFNGNKTVTAGGGGAVAGDDHALVALARHLSTTARRGADYDHDRVGYNYRMTNLQAAVGCAQLEQLGTLVDRKRAIRRAYDAAWRGIGGAGAFPGSADSGSACWLSGVILDPDLGIDARWLQGVLATEGIEARTFWKPMHLQTPYRNAPRSGAELGDTFWERVLTLPCSVGLAPAEQDRVIEAVGTAIRGRS